MGQNDESPERLIFFSDAVIAIAMTLLALDLPVPHAADPQTNRGLWHDFLHNWHTDYFPFLLSFVVIALFWNSHHRIFRHVARLGSGLTPVNFLFLLTVILVPFVTRVLGKDGRYQVSVVLYAADLALLAGSLAALAYLIKRRDLLAADVPRSTMDDSVWGLLPTAVVFALSIPVAIAKPAAATWVWLLLLVAGRLSGSILSRVRQHRRNDNAEENT